MARKSSGGWNKFLNFIGLIDDEDPRDTYGEEYQGGNYGRQSAYTPARTRSSGTNRTGNTTRQSGTRRTDTRETTRSRYEPRGTRVSEGGRSPAGYDDYQRTSGRASRFDDSDYEYPSTRTQPSSRFDSTPSASALERTPQRTARVPQRSRTVMYSLHSLEDCCEVIDQLIANNTVVLTMDDLDGHLMQRAVDTLSGAVFALHASIRKASQSGKTYLLAPMSVQVDDPEGASRW